MGDWLQDSIPPPTSVNAQVPYINRRSTTWPSGSVVGWLWGCGARVYSGPTVLFSVPGHLHYDLVWQMGFHKDCSLPLLHPATPSLQERLAVRTSLPVIEFLQKVFVFLNLKKKYIIPNQRSPNTPRKRKSQFGPVRILFLLLERKVNFFIFLHQPLASAYKKNGHGCLLSSWWAFQEIQIFLIL